MTNLTPGLILKEGVFSNGKTVESVRDSKNFSPFEQIIIFNQPTGYQHIYIATVTDLITLIWDIFDYIIYYNLYETYVELYELWKQTLHNYNTYEYHELFPRAQNIVLSKSKWQNLKTGWNIFIGKQLTCNLHKEQLEILIPELEQYFKRREVYTQKYGEDLLPHFSNFLCLDEIHNYFGTREWNQNFSGKNIKLREFISFPVKLRTRIEGITQSVEMLDINFRRQASMYKRHSKRFFGLLMKTQEYNVRDTEKPKFDDSEITSSRNRINLYQIFGLPKVQYYREFIPTSMDKNVYKKGMYFEHIRRMTNAWYTQVSQKEQKLNKEQKTIK